MFIIYSSQNFDYYWNIKYKFIVIRKPVKSDVLKVNIGPFSLVPYFLAQSRTNCSTLVLK